MLIKNISLDFLGHAGFLITDSSGKRIAIDPYNISDKVPQADIILITHSHYDHCSIKDIAKIAKKGATIVIPPDAQSKITHIDEINMQIVELGDEISINGIRIETIPAYNQNKSYHPKKQQWFGYLIKISEVVIYHAGDTDRISEMQKLTGYGKHNVEFVALLPVSGEFCMNADEAAEVAEMLKPDIAIPMHYGSGVAGTLKDAERFVEICSKKGINAKILNKI